MPVFEALAEMGRGANGKEVVATLRQHAPVALAHMPDLLPDAEAAGLLRSLEGSPAARMLRFMADALQALSRARPLLLILEDLHWSDPSTVDLLAVIAQRRAPARLLLVGTYRPVEAIGHPLSRVKEELLAKQLCVEIPLQPLSEPFVHDYVRLRLESPNHAERRSGSMAARAETEVKELARLIHRRTEGHPFFVARVLDHLAAEGWLSNEEGGSGLLQDVQELERLIPDDVVSLVEQQLSTLAPEECRLLETASVVGMDFSAALVAAVLTADPAAIDRACHTLARRGHILCGLGTEVRPGGGVTGRYSFLHGLVRQVLYDRLHAAERARIHLAVGTHLEAVHAGDVEHMGATLAEHFERGGNQMRALDHLEYAAETARRRCAYTESIRLLQRALDLLAQMTEPVEEERRWKVLFGLGGACWRAGQSALAHDWFEAALASARHCADPEPLAHTVLAYGRTLTARESERSDILANLTREAVEAVGQRHDGLRAQLLSRLAFALYYRPDGWRSRRARERRERLSDEALRIAQRLGDPRTRIVVLYNRHWSRWDPDNIEERQAIAAQLADLAHHESDFEMLAEAHAFRFCNSLEAGDRGSLDDALVGLSRLAEELHHPWYRYVASAYSTTRAQVTGRLSEARQCMERAHALGTEIDEPLGTALFGAQMIAQAFTRGEPLAALEKPLTAVAGQFPEYPIYGAILSRIFVDDGRLDRAQREIEQLATNDFGDLRRDNLWLSTLATLCFAVVRCADQRRAMILYELLLPHAGKGIVLHAGLGYLGCASRYAGMLAATLRKWTEAERHFETAIAFDGSLGATPWVFHTRQAHAEALLARGRRRDLPRVRELLQCAEVDAAELDMSELAAKCHAARVGLS